MEFRLVQHDAHVPGSGHDLSSPRRIAFASQIPKVGLNGFEKGERPIRLRGVLDDSTESFVSVHGAFKQGPFWVVSRTDPFPFDLGNHLPRMAQRSVVPEIVAMEHPRAWHGCLENMLSLSSWSRLVADVWRSERVCFECGSVPFRPDRLEGHEVWEDRPGDPLGPTRRLLAIHMLCGPCLEMKHLGSMVQRHGFEKAFARLCAINRIDPSPRPKGEAAAYRRLIEQRHAAAGGDGCTGWIFDLSLLAGSTLHLKDALTLRDDGSICRGADGDAGCVRVTDADVAVENGCIAIRPRGWAG